MEIILHLSKVIVQDWYQHRTLKPLMLQWHVMLMYRDKHHHHTLTAQMLHRHVMLMH